MGYETYMIMGHAMNAVSMLASLVIAATAAVVAVMLTMRKHGAAGGWILALAAMGGLGIDLVVLVLGFLFPPGAGGMGIMWAYLALRVFNLVFLAACAVGFLLMKPPAATAAGAEVAHG